MINDGGSVVIGIAGDWYHGTIERVLDLEQGTTWCIVGVVLIDGRYGLLFAKRPTDAPMEFQLDGVTYQVFYDGLHGTTRRFIERRAPANEWVRAARVWFRSLDAGHITSLLDGGTFGTLADAMERDLRAGRGPTERDWVDDDAATIAAAVAARRGFPPIRDPWWTAKITGGSDEQE